MRMSKPLTVALLAFALPACWGPIDPGKPGVRTRITPQAQGKEWAELKTKIDGVPPYAPGEGAEGHGAAEGHGTAEAPAAHPAPEGSAAPASH